MQVYSSNSSTGNRSVSDLPIGITMGDPAGVGPEITLKGLRDISAQRGSVPAIVYGSLSALRAAAERDAILAVIDGDGLPAVWPRVSVSVAPEPAIPPAMGQVQAAAGEIAYAAIAAAVKDAMSGKISAIVTAPISKDALNLAGHPYSGHTEMLGRPQRHVWRLHDAGAWRPSRLSRHHAHGAGQCSRALNRRPAEPRHRSDARCAAASRNRRAADCRGGPQPACGRIGVVRQGGWRGNRRPVGCGGYRAAGMAISGPISGDTVFVRALAREFDAVIAIYHDQGHIPVKLLGFKVDASSGRWIGLSGVNITLGLPFARTSVDHGTAFDIAGKGVASAQSMVEAIEFALNLVSRPVADPKFLTKQRDEVLSICGNGYRASFNGAQIAQITASAVLVSAAQSTSRPRPGLEGAVITPAMIGNSFRDLSPLMCSVEKTSCS